MGCAASQAASLHVHVDLTGPGHAGQPAQQQETPLPKRLLLGVTIGAIKVHLESLPQDVVTQANANIPRDEDGELLYPPSDELNGYVNQVSVKLQDANSSFTERLQQQGSPHVGPAEVFVSWYLGTPMHSLLDALQQYLQQHALSSDTKFWLCDFCIRQGDSELSDVNRLGEIVSAVGRTVLLLEPWDAPVPLKRAWCVFEVYHTQRSKARFDVIMSSQQQRDFEHALVHNFDKISGAIAASLTFSHLLPPSLTFSHPLPPSLTTFSYLLSLSLQARSPRWMCEIASA